MSHWRKCGSGQEGYHVIVGKKTDSKMGPHPERDGNPRAYAESIHAAGIARNGIRHGRSGKDGTDIACHDLASGQKPREDRIRKRPLPPAFSEGFQKRLKMWVLSRGWPSEVFDTARLSGVTAIVISPPGRLCRSALTARLVTRDSRRVRLARMRTGTEGKSVLMDMSAAIFSR